MVRSRFVWMAAVFGLGVAIAVGCQQVSSTGPGTAATAPADGYDRDDGPAAHVRLQRIGETLLSQPRIPAGIADKTGGIGLSWRVAILPALGEKALYDQFKLDEPWDSEHNKALIAKMPRIFESPRAPAPAGKTFLRSFVGPHAAMPPPPKGGYTAANPAAPPGQPVPGRRPVEFAHGGADTLLVIEAAEPVVWTKPDELVYDGGPGQDPKAALPKFGGPFANGAHAFRCDGTTVFLKPSISEEGYRAMLTATGEDVVRNRSDYGIALALPRPDRGTGASGRTGATWRVGGGPPRFGGGAPVFPPPPVFRGTTRKS